MIITQVIAQILDRVAVRPAYQYTVALVPFEPLARAINCDFLSSWRLLFIVCITTILRDSRQFRDVRSDVYDSSRTRDVR